MRRPGCGFSILAAAMGLALGWAACSLETRVCHGPGCTATDGARHLYRSVGPGRSTALATGASNPLDISGSLARFASPLPDFAGVGDALVYSDHAGGQSLAFIAGRSSATAFTVQAADGSPPPETSADASWSLWRAHTSLRAALDREANPSLPTDLTAGAIAGDGNLVAADVIWEIACYGDAPDQVVTSAPTVQSWTTGPQNYLRIYTPTLPTQVGVSQRHTGVWDSNKFHLVKSQNQMDHLLNIWTDHVRLEGLQIWDSSSDMDSVAIEVVAAGEAWLSDSIIRGNPANPRLGMGLIITSANTTSLGLWNNLIYGFSGRCLFDNAGAGSASRIYVYNNTFYACPTGVEVVHSTFSLKNNLINGLPAEGACIPVGDRATLGPSDHNVCNLNQPMTGSGSAANASASFVDAEAGDFRLAPDDTAALGRGADLSDDPDLPLTTNIAGQQRTAPWNIGAF